MRIGHMLEITGRRQLQSLQWPRILPVTSPPAASSFSYIRAKHRQGERYCEPQLSSSTVHNDADALIHRPCDSRALRAFLYCLRLHHFKQSDAMMSRMTRISRPQKKRLPTCAWGKGKTSQSGADSNFLSRADHLEHLAEFGKRFLRRVSNNI